MGLKLWRPRWFDGVALVVGAAAPDAAYAVTGLPIDIRSHAWHALGWFNLPLTVVVAVLIRRAAPYIVAHLPSGGRLAIRDYGVLATVRHPVMVTVCSALLAALSHQLWDSITHPYLLIGHPFYGNGTYLTAMHATAFAGLPWWRVIHLASELLGSAISIAVALRIGRRRLLVRWHGPAPIAPRRPLVFWPVAAAVWVALVAGAAALPRNDLINVAGSRLLIAVTVAVLAAAATVRWLAGPAKSILDDRRSHPAGVGNPIGD
ncbi:hypothetical protein Rhe02_57380 [Rhizocola hellebori]|uniref:DUF4184 family protein n=1 Tax=Rhizocola hellebori TaxID=1392758 RepID=A0A8J3QE68_9ACTN|nr:hypothetical protein Rhe02_57380 [Rhizocola hellebori]